MIVQAIRKSVSRLILGRIQVRWSTSTLTSTPTPTPVIKGKHVPVLLLGAPELTTPCKDCADDPLTHEKATLVATLEHFRKTRGFGRGIAAPQIGVLRRFIAINLGDGVGSGDGGGDGGGGDSGGDGYDDDDDGGGGGGGVQVLTDPVIINASTEKMTLYDDCMSLPWLLCKVERHASISIEFFNEAREKVTWENLPPDVSELLQHEIDHLDGVLLLDRAAGSAAGVAGACVSREVYENNRVHFDRQVTHSITPTISEN